MENIREVINETIEDIMEQKGIDCPELVEEINLMKGLAFVSMDIAQLIASLEIDLDLDPFSCDVSITMVQTLGDLYRVYEESAKKKEGEE